MTKVKIRYEVVHAPEMGEVIVDAKSVAEARRKFARLERNDPGELMLKATSTDPNYHIIKIVFLDPQK